MRLYSCRDSKTPSRSFQSLEEQSKARSSAYAILSGNCGSKIVRIDVQQEGCQDRSLRDAVFQTLQPASLAVTGSEGETSIRDKLHDHADHLLIRKKS